MYVISGVGYAQNQMVEGRMVGGFGAPQFFKSYDKKAIDSIAAISNVKCIKITYPHQLKQLAAQIRRELIKQSATRVEIKEVNLVDTPTTKYRHDAVTVIVYFR